VLAIILKSAIILLLLFILFSVVFPFLFPILLLLGYSMLFLGVLFLLSYLLGKVSD
jgi:hypothetical protein